MLDFMFEFAKNTLVSRRIQDEQLYAHALAEVDAGRRRPGLWAKAYAQASGSLDKAKAIYLDLLVQRLKDELFIQTKARQTSRYAATDKDDSSKKSTSRDAAPKEGAKRPISIKYDKPRLTVLSRRLPNEHLDPYAYAFIAEQVGGSLTWDGEIIKRNYVFKRNSQIKCFKTYRQIKPWYLDNVIPLVNKII